MCLNYVYYSIHLHIKALNSCILVLHIMMHRHYVLRTFIDEVMLFGSSWFVCFLFACGQHYSKSYKRMLDEILPEKFWVVQ